VSESLGAFRVPDLSAVTLAGAFVRTGFSSLFFSIFPVIRELDPVLLRHIQNGPVCGYWARVGFACAPQSLTCEPNTKCGKPRVRSNLHRDCP
jgi:hypothetical protein